MVGTYPTPPHVILTDQSEGQSRPLFLESSCELECRRMQLSHVAKNQNTPLTNDTFLELSRYYRPHFSQLRELIQHRSDGPVLQKRDDGTLIYISTMPGVSAQADTTAGDSSPIGPYHTKETVETFGITSVDTAFQQDTTGQGVEGQQVVLLNATTQNVDAYSGNTDKMTGGESSVSIIDFRQASELTDLLPISIHNQNSQKFMPVKTIKNSGGTKDDSEKHEQCGESESMAFLEQDIAQTLIQINPLSRFHNQSGKKCQQNVGNLRQK